MIIYPRAIAKAVGSSVTKPALFKYVLTSDKATCFIVPASFVTNLSASTKVVALADVSPSIIFNSVAVDVTPSNIFNSAVVTVAPSNISNSASDIPADPIVTVPAKVTLAPLNVIAVVGVDPDLITSSPLEFVRLPKVVPSSLSVTSAPPASKTISVVASNVIVDPESISAITGVVKVLFVSVAVEVA